MRVRLMYVKASGGLLDFAIILDKGECVAYFSESRLDFLIRKLDAVAVREKLLVSVAHAEQDGEDDFLPLLERFNEGLQRCLRAGLSRGGTCHGSLDRRSEHLTHFFCDDLVLLSIQVEVSSPWGRVVR